MNKFWIYLANIVKSNMVLKPKGDLKFRTDKSIEGSSILGYLVMIHIAKDLFDNKEEEVAKNNDPLDILDVPKFLKRQDA